MELGRLKESEREYLEGIALAEAIGEKRVKSLLESSLAVLRALLGDFDSGLTLAKENLAITSPNLIYNGFEALRCLAFVHYLRALSDAGSNSDADHLDEAERLCSEAYNLLSPTESRVGRLWLGPLQMDVLLAQSRRAADRDDVTLADEKRGEAQQLLSDYQQLVTECQSPRFTRQAERLAKVLS
jgi:hypothetical protein